MATPQPGELWVDLNPMTDRREWRDSTKYRRCVEVSAFDPNGFAEGSSFWQQRARGGWATMGYPPPRRTRIRAAVFARRFIRAEETP